MGQLWMTCCFTDAVTAGSPEMSYDLLLIPPFEIQGKLHSVLKGEELTFSE